MTYLRTSKSASENGGLKKEDNRFQLNGLSKNMGVVPAEDKFSFLKGYFRRLNKARIPIPKIASEVGSGTGELT